MHAPTAADLLDAWDAGVRASPARRALLLLGTVRPEPPDRLAAMPVGWIAAQLLTLREALLGPTLVCLSDCRRCDMVLESTVEISQLTALASIEGPDGAQSSSISIQHDSYSIAFRLPTCADLLGLQGDPAAAARHLAHSLIVHAEHRDVVLAPEALPSELHAEVERMMLERDPLAQIELALSCSSCGWSGAESLHVADFVWTEIDAWAERTLGDVARLAQAFGWGERDILQMSSQRRHRYLELLPS